MSGVKRSVTRRPVLLGRNNCGCLDDLLLFVYWRRGLWVIAGSIVLAQARSAEVRLSRSSSGTSRICLS
jgi:hypothetical protein